MKLFFGQIDFVTIQDRIWWATVAGKSNFPMQALQGAKWTA